VKYAARTTVASDKSRDEIKKTVQRYGATRYATLDEPGRAVIAFELHERRIRFTQPLPDMEDFYKSPGGRRRSESAAQEAYEQATRQRWRGLALLIKAKLEAVENNTAIFDEEFMAYTVMPNGQTVSEMILPQIKQSYLTGKTPPLLLGDGGAAS
jgi:hypothetical protein